MTLRTWNILAFAALCNPSDSWTSILFSHFSTFSFTYNVSLRGFGISGTNAPETAQADINYAFNAIKLWLLLALKKFRLKGVSPNKEKDPAVLEDNEDAATRMVWNELWPSFALLVDSFEPEARTVSRVVCSSSMGDDTNLKIATGRTDMVLSRGPYPVRAPIALRYCARGFVTYCIIKSLAEVDSRRRRN